MKKDTLTSSEVCELLKIKPQTLYAYVSRGLLRSEAMNSSKRNYRYLRSDVEKLQQKKKLQRHPEKVLRDALHWGAPLLQTQLSHFEQDMLYYRDTPISELVQQPFENTIKLLWGTAIKIKLPLSALDLDLADFKQRYAHFPFLQQVQLALILLAESDPHCHTLTPQRIINTALQILAVVVYLACGEFPTLSIASTLQSSWQCSTKLTNSLNTALVVCAEHELNTSTFTGRCIASTDATLYQVIIGAIAAFSGNKHGGILEQITHQYHALINSNSLEKDILRQLRHGTLAGFNHPLYSHGDPRAKLLLAALAESKPTHPAYQKTQKMLALLHNEGLEPSIDFALVVTEQCLNLPPDSALKLFIIGRVAGWVAHALEQYQRATQIRPRSNVQKLS